MKVALVNPSYFDPFSMENVGIVESMARRLPPLSLMYVSSILKENGHDCIIIDGVGERLSKRKIVRRIEEYGADVIGFSVIAPSRKLFKFMEYVKRKTGKPIIVGGHILLYYPEAILSNQFVDYAIIGSALHSLPKLLEALEYGGGIDEIEGVGFKKEGKIIINYPKDIRKKLEELPIPDRDAINNALYFSVVSTAKPYTIMVTSSGCIYKCSFCPMGRLPYEERRIEDVVREIKDCVEKYGIKEIDIQDENFLFNKERTLRLIKEISKMKLNVRFSCRARVDSVDEDILKALKKAGCWLIMYGIESGSEEALKREHKGITHEKIKNAILATKKHGIKVLGFFIIGNEGENEESIRKTIWLAKNLPLDYAQFFHMVVKPGTELYDEIKEKLGYDYFDLFLRGKIKKKELNIPWTNLDSRKLKFWVFIAYLSFYMRRKHVGTLLRLFINSFFY